MACTAYSLHGYGNGAGGADLADEVDIADVYSELQRCCRYKNLYLSIFQSLLGVEAKGSRERTVMCGDVFGAETGGEFKGYFFDEAASVDEDEGGAVILSVGGEFVEDFGPHAIADDGAKLVAGNLDRYV